MHLPVERDREKLLRLKAALLCYGLKANEFSEELARIFDPSMEKRTGLVGVQLKLGDYVVNAAMDKFYENTYIYTNKSEYELRKVMLDGQPYWVLFRSADNHRGVNRVPITTVELIEQPSWYTRKTKYGRPMTEIFLSEGEANLMGCAFHYCAFFEEGKQCKFCALDQRRGNDKRPSEFAEVAVAAYSEDPNITMTINSGTLYSPDRGLKRLTKYVEAIMGALKKECDISYIPLQIECAPPDDIRYLQNIIEAGANSFSINLEIFDEKIRKEVCPGKSQIPFETYERSWSYVVEKLGDYRAASVLIFGLEPIESTIEGAEYLLERGVLPNIVPFRPLPGSVYENRKPVNHEKLFEVYLEIAKLIKKHGVDTNMRLGCSTCKGCSMELDTI